VFTKSSKAGLCLHSGGEAGKKGSPRLPKAAFQCQGEQLFTPEAAEAVICQGELLCTPEAAEAGILCQGRLLCTPEAAEAAVLCCVHKIFKGQPEAAVQGQAELRMASEKLCMQPPGHTMMQWSEPSAGTVKGFKYQVLLHQSQNLVYNHKAKPSKAEEEDMDNNGNEEAHTLEAAEVAVLWMASERFCMPPPGHAGGGQPEVAVQGHGALCLPPGGDAGKEGSPQLPKAAVLCQGELLCTLEAAEAAVLCQGGRMVASESCLQASGLRRASERLCGPTPGYAGGGQPEAVVQGQGALCWPPGGDAGKEGSPRLPKAAVLCQGGLLCTPEAADAEVLCGVYKIFKGQAVLALRR
jgi:energy-converting hydrogenase Eha subunit B